MILLGQMSVCLSINFFQNLNIQRNQNTFDFWIFGYFLETFLLPFLMQYYIINPKMNQIIKNVNFCRRLLLEQGLPVSRFCVWCLSEIISRPLMGKKYHHHWGNLSSSSSTLMTISAAAGKQEKEWKSQLSCATLGLKLNYIKQIHFLIRNGAKFWHECRHCSSGN